MWTLPEVLRVWIRFLKRHWKITAPIAVLIALVIGFLVIQASGNKDARSVIGDTTTEPSSEQSDALAENGVSSESGQASSADSSETTATQKTGTGSTQGNPKPKNNETSVQLLISQSTITVHAGWDSSNVTASLSDGSSLSGVAKAWDDKSPVSVVMPLGQGSSKSVSFFVQAPIDTKPGNYTIRLSSGSAAATLTVQVKRPLFSLESVTYDGDFEVFVLKKYIDPAFSKTTYFTISAPKGVPCQSGMHEFEDIDDTETIWGCTYGENGVAGSYPITFTLTDGSKQFSKSVIWNYTP